MRAWVGHAAVCIVAIGCSGLAAQNRAPDHIRNGQVAFDREDWGRAVSEFELAVTDEPSDATAYYNLGLALHRWGDLAGAQESLQTALSLRPRFAQAYLALGLVLRDLDDGVESGFGEFQRAFESNPSLPEAIFNIGVVHWRAGRTEAAIEAFRKAVTLRDYSAEFHFRLGQALAKNGDSTEAQQELEKALELDGSHTGARYQLGRLYSQTGDKARADTLLGEVQVAGQKSARADESSFAYQQGLAALERGDTQSAIKILNGAPAHDRDPNRIRKALAIAHQRNGEFDAAARLLGEVLVEVPGDVDGHLNLAVILIHQGKATEAEKELHAALEISPRFAEAHYNLGILKASQRNWERAIESLRRCLEITPSHATARFNLARVFRDSGEEQLAIEVFDQAWQSDRSLSLAGMEYGELLSKHERYDKALEVWRATLLRDPTNAALHQRITQAISHLEGDEAVAIERTQLSLLLTPEFRKGLGHLAAGNAKDAAGVFAEILGRNPALWPVRWKLAFALMADQQYARAAEHLRTLAEEFSNDAAAQTQLGIAFRETGATEAAKRAFSEAIRLNPAAAHAHYNLGLLYLRLNDGAAAMSEFHKARRLDPSFLPPKP